MALPSLVTLAQALGPVQQDHLLQARQMQALSFAVHIPLVCFGIALPVMVLFAEWLYLRSGDRVYRTLAQRWSRLMVTLFAVGVCIPTWPYASAHWVSTTFGLLVASVLLADRWQQSVRGRIARIRMFRWGRLADEPERADSPA